MDGINVLSKFIKKVLFDKYIEILVFCFSSLFFAGLLNTCALFDSQEHREMDACLEI